MLFLLLYLATAALATTVGVPQPFSMPPLPEEPALLRIAAKDSIACVTWSGAADADPQSDNRTERLCAEPDVRRAVAALQDALKAVMLREMGMAGGPAQGALDLAVAALQRPGCAFVSGFDPRDPSAVRAGLAVKLGDRMNVAQTLIGMGAVALRAEHRDGEETWDDLEVDDVRFRALPLPVTQPFVGWAAVDGWLLVAVGRDTAAPMLAGLHGDDQGLRGSAATRRLLAAAEVERPATRTFVDLAKLQTLMSARHGPLTGAMFEALGLGQATAALATTGLHGDGFRAQVRLAVPKPAGLLAALAGPPITQDALIAVPRDADVALAVRTDPQLLQNAVVDLFDAMTGGRVRGAFDGFRREWAAQFGFDWNEGVTGQLDGQLTAWNAPSQGGLGITAATARLGLRDGGAFAQPFGVFMGQMQAEVPSKKTAMGDGRLRRNGVHLETFAHGDHTAWWIDDLDDDVPFAWSWSAGRDALTFAMTPQALRCTLDAVDAPNPDHSLVRLPAVSRRGAATLMLHVDLQSLLRRGYPLAMLLLQSADEEWLREGFDFDAADLPRQEALARHLGQELTTVAPVDGGFEYLRSGALPVVDPLTMAVVLAVALPDM